MDEKQVTEDGLKRSWTSMRYEMLHTFRQEITKILHLRTILRDEIAGIVDGQKPYLTTKNLDHFGRSYESMSQDIPRVIEAMIEIAGRAAHEPKIPVVSVKSRDEAARALRGLLAAEREGRLKGVSEALIGLRSGGNGGEGADA